MKKLLSIILSFIIILGSVSVISFADSEESYPLIVVPGYSASYLYAVEADGQKRQIWGSFEGLGIVDAILSNIAEIGIGFGGAVMGCPDHLAKTLGEGAREILKDIAYKPDGTPVIETVTYPNDPAVTNYKYLIDELGSMHAAEIEIMDDIKDLYGEKGYQNIFSFQTDFRMNIVDAAENLKNYIDSVLEYTGADKADIFAVSYGGQITATYLNLFGLEGKIHNAVLTVPAIGGAALAYDAMSGNVRFDEETLFRFLENGMMIEEDINWLMKAHSLGFLDELLNKAVEYGIRDIVGFWGSIWDFIPAEYYDELKSLYLDPVESAKLIEKSDKFHYEILPSMTSRLQDCVDSGIGVYIVAGYGNPAVTGLNEQSDGIIHISASTGAECAPYGQRFSDGYTCENAVCSALGHNHISPEMTIDASAGYLPEQTWYVSGLFHGMTWKDDYTKALCKTLLMSRNVVDVYSFEEYPQFRYSTNPCFAVDLYFSGSAYGTLSSDSESLIIKNISQKYDVTVLSVVSDGADLRFDLPACTNIKPGDSIEVFFDGYIPECSQTTADISVNFSSFGSITPQGIRTLTFTVKNGNDLEYDSENPYSDESQPTFFDRIINSFIEKLLIKSGMYDLFRMLINCFVSMIPVK